MKLFSFTRKKIFVHNDNNKQYKNISTCLSSRPRQHQYNKYLISIIIIILFININAKKTSDDDTATLSNNNDKTTINLDQVEEHTRTQKHYDQSPSNIIKLNSKPLSKLAFASCYHQDKNTTIFKAIKNYKPDVFLWTGDAVYHKDGHNITTLENNYIKQYKRTDYKNFRESKPKPYIDGTWDDHDYGVNDAGKDLNEKNLRQNLFLNFLEVPLKSKRRTRKGMYSTFTYGPPGKKVRFILLDTRTFRDKHVIPSVGGVSWLHPFGAVIACITRFFSSVFGFDVDYNGDVLGEEQWHWFEQVLNDTVRNGHDVKFNIIVSSIQVFSSNPLFEGWTHFPRSRVRLLNIISRNRPKGLIFLSGDVHFGEFLGWDNDEQGGLIEVTSSGLTHTCTTPYLYGFTCPYILHKFKDHRSSDHFYYTGKNFGSIDFDWKNEMVTISIRNETGHAMLMNQMSTINQVPSWIERLENYDNRVRFSSHRATDNIAKYILYGAAALVVVMASMGFIGLIYEQFFENNRRTGSRARRVNVKEVITKNNKKMIRMKKPKMKKYKFYNHEYEDDRGLK